MADSNVSYWIVMMFFIFHTAVSGNSTPLGSSCVTNADFNVRQMAGTWHLIAGIYRLSSAISCGKLVLRNVSEHRLTGQGTMKFHEVTRSAAVQGFVANQILAMRYVWNDTISQEQLFLMKTCDSKREFSLEHEKEGWFLIFGRNGTATTFMLDHYRQYAVNEGLNLRFVREMHC